MMIDEWHYRIMPVLQLHIVIMCVVTNDILLYNNSVYYK